MNPKMIATLVVGLLFILSLAGIVMLASMKRTNSLQKTLFDCLVGWASICFTTLVGLVSTGIT